MADAAVPLLNLAILGSFFTLGVAQLRGLEAARVKEEEEQGED